MFHFFLPFLVNQLLSSTHWMVLSSELNHHPLLKVTSNSLCLPCSCPKESCEACPPTVDFSDKCPPTFKKVLGGCYYLNSTKVTWIEAVGTCQDANLELVSIQSEPELNVVQNLIKNSKDLWWTSGSLFNGKWQWAGTGTQMSLSYGWGPNEPKKYGNAKQQCIELRKYSKKHLLNNVDCSRKTGFICEKLLKH